MQGRGTWGRGLGQWEGECVLGVGDRGRHRESRNQQGVEVRVAMEDVEDKTGDEGREMGIGGGAWGAGVQSIVDRGQKAGRGDGGTDLRGGGDECGTGQQQQGGLLTHEQSSKAPPYGLKGCANRPCGFCRQAMEKR